MQVEYEHVNIDFSANHLPKQNKLERKITHSSVFITYCEANHSVFEVKCPFLVTIQCVYFKMYDFYLSLLLSLSLFPCLISW